MQFFAKITDLPEEKVAPLCEALANLGGDEASASAMEDLIAESGVVLFTAQLAISVDRLVREFGGSLDLDSMTQTVAVPFTAGEDCIPKSFRASTMISRLLGEEKGDIPTSAVYDLIDIITSVDVPEEPSEAMGIADALARAVLGITQAVPEEFRKLSGIEAFKAAYLASVEARNEAATADL